MSDLFVFCDGTWNSYTATEDGLPAPTNVVRLYNAVAETNGQQRYYHPGVGTDGGIADKLTGGGLGIGLARNIMSAYRWLAARYVDGDRIFLFGFSRGAYTVRSLAGMIGACGLLALHGRELPEAEIWRGIRERFDAYRARGDGTGTLATAPSVTTDSPKTPIHFLGVWDTVGALGIPDEFALLNLLDDPSRHRFHDLILGKGVRHARHAVAIDEMRATFVPTLWANEAEAGQDRSIKQVWFPGVHGDVGGGYVHCGLSDVTLRWMLEEMLAVSPGVQIASGAKDQLRPDPFAILHESVRGVFKTFYTSPRNVPWIHANSVKGGLLDQSAKDRLANPPLTQPPYWPTEVLGGGRSKTVEIFARQLWNFTGLYLEEGETYDFQAKGEWLDGRLAFGPGGAPTTFHPRRWAYAGAGAIESLQSTFRQRTRNKEAKFWYTRRHPEHRWYALIGVVASGGLDSDGRLRPHETFEIGVRRSFAPKLGGYLFCFANDAWQTYGNNRGSVQLTVSGGPLDVEEAASA